nr:hypothetical protein [uncultured Albidiferax sp.]
MKYVVHPHEGGFIVAMKDSRGGWIAMLETGVEEAANRLAASLNRADAVMADLMAARRLEVKPVTRRAGVRHFECEDVHG